MARPCAQHHARNGDCHEHAWRKTNWSRTARRRTEEARGVHSFRLTCTGQHAATSGQANMFCIAVADQRFIDRQRRRFLILVQELFGTCQPSVSHGRLHFGRQRCRCSECPVGRRGADISQSAGRRAATATSLFVINLANVGMHCSSRRTPSEAITPTNRTPASPARACRRASPASGAGILSNAYRPMCESSALVNSSAKAGTAAAVPTIISLRHT